MKKIFAFILASIMILSLVPASAFAAVTKCPEDHTLDNCEATVVKEVEASCEKAGYKLYACNACGTTFVGEVVPVEPHVWISNANGTTRQDVKPQHTKKNNGVNGYKYVKCVVCDYETKLTINWKDYFHSLESENNTLQYKSGDGCGTRYKCTLFDCSDVNGKTVAEGQTSFSHGTFEFVCTKSLPTWVDDKAVDGSAIFACDKCGDTKEIIIKANTHTNDCFATRVKIVEAVNPTCESDGTYAVYECTFCGKLSLENGTIIDSVEDAYRPVREHKLKDASKIDYNAGECTKTGVCEYPDCLQVVTVEAHRNKKLVYDVDSTCTALGYKTWLCLYCGEYTVETEDRMFTGHDIVTVVVPATCQGYSYTYQYCANDNCDKAEKNEFEFNKVKYPLYKLDENGEIVYTKTKVNYVDKSFKIIGDFNPKAHSYVAHNIQTGDCTTDKVTLYLCSLCGKADVETIPAAGHKWVGEYTEIASTCATPGSVSGTCSVCGPVNEALPLSEEHEIYLKQIQSTCSENPSAAYENKGTKYHTVETWGCECGSPEYEFKVYKNPVNTTNIPTDIAGTVAYADALHHGIITFDKDGNATYNDGTADELSPNTSYTPVASTCKQSGVEVYDCSKCSKKVIVTLPKAEHNTTFIVIGVTEDDLYTAPVAPNCSNGTKKVEGYYTCQLCGEYYVYVDANDEIVPKGTAGAQQKEVSISDITGSTHNVVLHKAETPCVNKAVYKCTICNKYSLKESMADSFTATDIDSKSALDHKWETLVAAQANNCNTEGVIGAYWCPDCELLRFTKKTSYITYEYEKISGDEPGRWLYDTITAQLDRIEKVKDTILSKPNGDIYIKHFDKVNYTYADQQLLKGVLDYVNGEWVTATTPRLEHKKYDDNGVLNVNCITTSVGHAHGSSCEENCAIAEYNRVKCSLCSYEYLTNYKIECTEHVNADGQVLLPTCENDNAIPDDGDPYFGNRVCVRCKAHVVATHSFVTEKVPATCVADGYWYKYCTNAGCTQREVIKVIESDGECTEADEVDGSIASDYATVGKEYVYCKSCGKVKVNKASAPLKGNGLEIYLSTDAESYIPGSSVFVTVTLDSLKGVDVWALRFPVIFDADIYEFKGYEFNTAESAFQTFICEEAPAGYEIITLPALQGTYVSNGKYKPSGILNIIANADDEVEIKGAQTLVVLEFVVKNIPTTDDFTNFTVKDHMHTYDAGTLEKIDPVLDSTLYDAVNHLAPGYNYKVVGGVENNSLDCPAEAINGKGVEIDVIAADEDGIKANSVDVEIKEFLDIDGNDGLTLSDAHALYALIYNNEYDAAADADFDGFITAKDLTVLYNILVGKTTVKDYLSSLAPSDSDLPAPGTIMPR